MSDFHILQLDDDCLGHLLEYLEIQDQINFARVCTRFRQVLKDRTPILYPEYKIEDNCFEDSIKLFFIVSANVKKLLVNVKECQGFLNALKNINEELFYQQYFKAIGNMRSLERLVLCGVYADSRRIFDRYFLALSLLPNLKSLNILTNQGFKGDHLKELSQLKNLEELSTDIGMTTPQWIAFLKSNPKLRSLQFRVCRIIPEKPADLVPYCTSLEELYIWFKSKCDSYDYGAFAQLPNLKHLHIIGKYQQTDSTVQLFRSLVARDPQLLESLSIKRGMLTFDETQEIVHIKSLKELNCSFSDIECVDLLTQLTELEELSILLKSDTDISNAALRILKSCTNLKLFRIYAENIRRDFIFEAYNILKEIREPSKQPPLSLEVPYGKFALMKPEEERRIDPAYIRIDPKHAA